MPRAVRKPVLHVPVETMNREFDGKLLLSLIAADRGFDVYLGGQAAMHENLIALPLGIYFSKGVRSPSRKIFDLLDGFGHSIVALDEEALVRFDLKHFHFKLDPETFGRPRFLFAWGGDNAEAWASFSGYRGTPIIEAGNPRIDLLRPELRGFHREAVAGLRERFGDFILINSNFAVVNHFVKNLTRYAVADWVPPLEADQHKTGFLAHKQEIFQSLLAALPAIAQAVAPATVVVRPHPSENPTIWEVAARGLDNVVVLHEGPVAPWLMAAAAVVHNSCTTAVEAAVVGTPAIWFAPVESADFDIHLPNALSFKTTTVAELVAAVSTSLVTNGAPPEAIALSETQRLLLDHHIAALDGALASERIVDTMVANLDRLKPRGHALGGRLKARLRYYKWRLKRTWNAYRNPDGRNYLRHKFPELDEGFANDRLHGLAAALGRFEDRRAMRVGPDLLRIV